MQDMIPKGNGNSRYLKSSIPESTTWQQVLTMLRNGTFPIDLNGINPDGVTQQGTPLNKESLLTDATSASIWFDGSEPADPTVNNALAKLQSNIIYPQIVVETQIGDIISIQKDGIVLEYTAVGSSIVFDVPEFGVWTVTGTRDGINSDPTTLTVDIAKQYRITLKYDHIYGVSWDGTSTSIFSRTDDAANFTNPVPYVAGATAYYSPFDNLRPWAGMKKVNDSEAGILVSIPKYWYKWTKTGDMMKLQIADTAVNGFYVSPAHADRGDGKGERDIVYVGRYHCVSGYKSATGYNPLTKITRATARNGIHALGSTIWQYDFAMYWTIMMLYLVEFADWNGQKTIGYGCSPSNTQFNTGYTDDMPYHTGTTAANRTTYGGTQYRYIESLWDNAYDWCDGIYFSSTNIYCIKNPVSFSDSSGGTQTGTRPTGNGYISAWNIPTTSGFEYALYPSAISGSETTYACDYCTHGTGNGGSVLRCGGSFIKNQQCGPFYFVGSGSATQYDISISCRLQKLP